jgi:hypothetical protein
VGLWPRQGSAPGLFVQRSAGVCGEFLRPLPVKPTPEPMALPDGAKRGGHWSSPYDGHSQQATLPGLPSWCVYAWVPRTGPKPGQHKRPNDSWPVFPQTYPPPGPAFPPFSVRGCKMVPAIPPVAEITSSSNAHVYALLPCRKQKVGREWGCEWGGVCVCVILAGCYPAFVSTVAGTWLVRGAFFSLEICWAAKHPPPTRRALFAQPAATCTVSGGRYNPIEIRFFSLSMFHADHIPDIIRCIPLL